MAFAEFRAETEEQLDPLELVEPVLPGRGGLVCGHVRAWKGARWSEMLRSHRAIACQGAVAEDGDKLEVLVEEHDRGDSEPAADHERAREVKVGVAVEEADLDEPGVGPLEEVERRALLNTVAAPEPRENEDVQLSRKALDE